MSNQCFPSRREAVPAAGPALVLRSADVGTYDRDAVEILGLGGRSHHIEGVGSMQKYETRKPLANSPSLAEWVRSGPFLGALALLIGIASVGLSQSSPALGENGIAAGGVVTALDPAAVSKVGAAGDMIGFSHSDASGTQTITIVHTGKSWMAVYHIDRSGTIRLVSSRPIDADFSLQLNATSPLPEEIRQFGRR